MPPGIRLRNFSVPVRLSRQVAVLPKKNSRSPTTTGEGIPAPLFVRDQRIAAVCVAPFGGVRSPRLPGAIAAAGDRLPGLDVPK